MSSANRKRVEEPIDPRLQFHDAVNGDGKGVTDVFSEEKHSVRIRLIGRQTEHRRNILDHTMNITYGPAGTGKTHVPVATAIELMCKSDNPIKHLLYVRPSVTAGGKTPPPTPGSVAEKNSYLLPPLFNVLTRILDSNSSQRIINDLNSGNEVTGSSSKFREGKIIFEPMGFQRGNTMDQTMIIVDEAGSASELELELLLGRLGVDSKICFVGDRGQKDIPQPSRTMSDFAEIMRASFNPLYETLGVAPEKIKESQAELQKIIDRHTKPKLSAFENLIINARSNYNSECGVFEYTTKDIVRSPVLGSLFDSLFPQMATDDAAFKARISQAKAAARGIGPA